MNETQAIEVPTAAAPGHTGHRLWVRLTHWLIAAAVLTLFVSGVTILMAHPRLYWGTGGNDLTPALIELPIGPNSAGAKFAAPTAVPGMEGVVTANRLAEPWNQNNWGRSLHFLAAWFFLAGLLAYLAIALVSGHLRRNIVPGSESGGLSLREDIRAHLSLPMPASEPGPPYSILQKIAYALVVVVALPLMVLTGLTMSPAVSAAYPVLLDIFGGPQSARTIHFFTFAFLAIFLVVHLVMILLTGPWRQVRGMIAGS